MSYAQSGPSERPISERPFSEGVTSAHTVNGSGNGNLHEEGAGISGGPVRAERSLSEVFLLGTLALALIAWVVALISQAVVAGTISDAPVRILWFGIIIQTILTALVGLVIVESSTSNAAYGSQISMFAAIATVFAVLGVDQNIYSSRSAQQATGAGWLLIAIVDLLWIFFFTSPPQSPVFRLAALAGRGGQRKQHSVQKIGRSTDAFPMSPVAATDLSQQPSSPQQEEKQGSTAPQGYNQQGGNTAIYPPKAQSDDETTPDSSAQWRAQALFDYPGSASDPNEIDFSKGDILLIFEKSGKWWEAKKEGGRKGIAPSNYLRLL